MPPSPLLSARRIKTTYLSVTTTISAQKIVETAPMMFTASRGMALSGPNTSFIVYKRAGADVAIDNPECAEGDDSQGLFWPVRSSPCGRVQNGHRRSILLSYLISDPASPLGPSRRVSSKWQGSFFGQSQRWR